MTTCMIQIKVAQWDKLRVTGRGRAGIWRWNPLIQQVTPNFGVLCLIIGTIFDPLFVRMWRAEVTSGILSKLLDPSTSLEKRIISWSQTSLLLELINRAFAYTKCLVVVDAQHESHMIALDMRLWRNDVLVIDKIVEYEHAIVLYVDSVEDSTP